MYYPNSFPIDFGHKLIRAIAKADLKFGGQYYSSFEYVEDEQTFETDCDIHLTLEEAMDSLVVQAEKYGLKIGRADFVVDMLEGKAICDIAEMR